MNVCYLILFNAFVKTMSCCMIVNKTTIHQSSNEVDVVKCMQPYGLQQRIPYLIVGFLKAQRRKNETIEMRKLTT